METENRKPGLDGAIIHLELLQRSLMSRQPTPATPEPSEFEMDRRSIRIDTLQRELLRHPFHNDIH